MTTPVTDDELRGRLAAARPCHAFLVRKGPRFDDATTQPLQWEHARNMLTLLRDGRLRAVSPLMDGTDVVGYGIVEGGTRAEAEALLAEDPAVRGGRLTVQVLQGFDFRADAVR